MDYSELYFVARSDIGPDGGRQRVFGAFDDVVAAKAFLDQLVTFQVGQFKIFKGQAIPESEIPAP